MDGTTYIIGTVEHHSFNDFGLIRVSRPLISPPVVKTIIVDNPGTNGVIDLTEALTEYPTYENRTITERYIVRAKPKQWDLIISDVSQILDGMTGQLRFDTDPAYYWQGRSVISAIDKHETYMLITITSDVFPFKYERFHSLQSWEWDPFNFDVGIIRDYSNIEVDGELSYTIIGTKMPVVPTFSVSSGSSLTVQFEGSTYDLPAGSDNIILHEGRNTLLFKGTGTVSILYRGGVL